MNAWWKKRWAQNSAFIFLGIIGVYALVYWDVTTRAKEAYMEGEKYMAWNQHPEQKQKFFEDRFSQEKAKLEKQLSDKKISEEDMRKKLDTLEFDRDYALNESSLKYAYQWYKDTYELFSPPESKWVKLAREKAPQALEAWKQELRAQNVPFEDYMFE